MAATIGIDLLDGLSISQLVSFRSQLQTDFLRGQLTQSNAGDTGFSRQVRSFDEQKELIRLIGLRLFELDPDTYPLRVAIRRTSPSFTG